ncbi:hypothetical protein A6M27_02675 [Acidithiobacillus thiooxidans]|uniref:Uncharacterized protein n=1 Tax=Acidithiobacillus thiooxidans TaxID=930 RepID=A0A1C2IR95_ACITH|nr:hypothetical protein A6O24_15200 [Acidithiobacillus thiooxidans]OCX76276.1 hypothetical protein A6P07_02975 [Acidithiobacillus thiooxidans]OCX78472.1 hypothetical protein A6O26_17985 [Acidithiobacillus thiooxidans]OCX89253.1 hypothetical protein A6M27_02675 [Acidithiobacillus thiooxidans]OFC42631.1 hypothetical protein BAE47_14885 [Acidithiobacillus thiooxidans]
MHFLMTEFHWTAGQFIFYRNLFLVCVDACLTFWFTSRVAYYHHGGRMPIILYPCFWIFFYFTSLFILALAIPLRLLGVRLFPVFGPKGM